MAREQELLERHHEIARIEEYDQDEDDWAVRDRARRIEKGWITPAEAVNQPGASVGDSADAVREA